MRRNDNEGLTLIELLIVVAIIGILVATAVPNLLEAQARAKVSRVRADMRAIETACECYRMDYNALPNETAKLPPGGWWQTQLTTPIAYLTGGCCCNPFCRDATLDNLHYQYAHCEHMKSFVMVSVGPDGEDLFNEAEWRCPRRFFYPIEYDPTNGTISPGDVWRVIKQGGVICD